MEVTLHSTTAFAKPAWLTLAQNCVKATGREWDFYSEQSFIMRGCLDCILGSRHKRTNCAGGVPVSRRAHFNKTIRSHTQLCWTCLLLWYKLLELESRFRRLANDLKLAKSPQTGVICYYHAHAHQDRARQRKWSYTRWVKLWSTVGVCLSLTGQTSSSWENSSLAHRSSVVNVNNDNKRRTNI